MFKVQLFNKIAKTGLDQFPANLYEASADMREPDVMLVRSHSLHDVMIPSSVKAIGRAGAGVNNIPVAHMTELGVPVFNTPGANANAVCELVLAGMLIASRHLCAGWDYARQLTGDDKTLNETIEANKKMFAGSEIRGKVLGIIGLGSIGVRVANAAIHLGMQVIGYDPTISVNRAWELSSQVIQAHHLEELLKVADYVSIHVPLLEATKHLLNAERLKLMKHHAVLLNFARDGIVDNQALCYALQHKQLSAYVCDFPSASLQGQPAVISFPHLGASTHEAEENCAVMLVKQIRQYLEYGAILHSVNFPSVEVSPNYAGERLAIVNANVPSMVAQISAALADARLNILSLVNKSREEIAYTLLDVDGVVSKATIEAIAGIEGILQVRAIGQCSVQSPLK